MSADIIEKPKAVKVMGTESIVESAGEHPSIVFYPRMAIGWCKLVKFVTLYVRMCQHDLMKTGDSLGCQKRLLKFQTSSKGLIRMGKPNIDNYLWSIKQWQKQRPAAALFFENGMEEIQKSS